MVTLKKDPKKKEKIIFILVDKGDYFEFKIIKLSLELFEKLE
jgi:hypothetical protein